MTGLLSLGRAIGLSAAFLWPAAAVADHDRLPDPPPAATDAQLPSDLDLASRITVSGLSSGGYFAHQLHVAYSQLVEGAGIVAGGPYGCVETIPNPYWPFARLDRLSAALLACTHYRGDRYWGLRPAPPSAQASADLIEEAWERGAIDDPAHLSEDRVWLFRGSADDVVPEAAAAALESLYRRLNLAEPRLAVHRHAAAHGLPVGRPPEPSRFPPRSCGEHAAPYIIDCGFDAAGLLLRHLYGEGFAEAPVDAHAGGTLLAFDQEAFWQEPDRRASLGRVGYLYLPHECRSGPCRLHVALHGCRQTADHVHDDFVRDGGYNGWAAANRIVVLYPQAIASAVNPNGCWDFWGYSGPDYRTREGAQMRAVKAMVDHLLGPGR